MHRFSLETKRGILLEPGAVTVGIYLHVGYPVGVSSIRQAEQLGLVEELTQPTDYGRNAL